jgi:hypothetical protein
MAMFALRKFTLVLESMVVDTLIIHMNPTKQNNRFKKLLDFFKFEFL